MTRDEIAAEIVNARFSTRSFGVGYGQFGVDEFLDRLREAVARGDSAGNVQILVDEARFAIRWGGYGEGEVDTFLDRVVGLCADASPGATSAAAPATAAPRTPRAQVATASGSALIEPRPGLFARLGRKLRQG